MNSVVLSCLVSSHVRLFRTSHSLRTRKLRTNQTSFHKTRLAIPESFFFAIQFSFHDSLINDWRRGERKQEKKLIISLEKLKKKVKEKIFLENKSTNSCKKLIFCNKTSSKNISSSSTLTIPTTKWMEKNVWWKVEEKPSCRLKRKRL